MIDDKGQIDIFKSLKSDAINELTPELLEIALDLTTDSEVLKDIPVFGSLFKVGSLYNRIKEIFFTKKLFKFLFELKEISLLKREEFVKKLESDKETRKAGEKLLVTLVRLNDDEKATIVGRLFKHTILGSIKYQDFKRLTHIIDLAFLNDIKLLKNNPHLSYIDDEIKSNLYQLGLIKQSISDVNRQLNFLKKTTIRNHTNEVPQPKFEYKINNFGLMIVEFAFDLETD